MGPQSTPRHYFMDANVSVNNLKKAFSLWWKGDPHNEWSRSRLTETEQSSTLMSILAAIFPKNVAVCHEDRW